MARGERRDDALARALDGALAAHAGDEHPDEGLVARYLTRELPPDEVERVERHAAACARCAGELAAAAAVEAEAQAAASAPTAPASTPASASAAAPAATVSATAEERDRIRAEIRAARAERAEPRRRRGRSFLRIAAVLAVVVLAGGALASRWALGRLQPVLFDGMASVLGREVTGGGASLVLAGGPGLRLDDVQIAEDPGFGGGDFATVRGAVLQVDPGELLRGRVRGAVRLDSPAVHLIRDRSGMWNVETLAGREPGGAAGVPGLPPDVATPRGAGAPREQRVREAKERLVRLTSASIENGTLEITDRADGGRELVLRDLDLSYASADPGAPSSIELSGTIGGEAQRIALRGEIGPFEGGAEPRWDFEQVKVARLPLDDVPGAPDAVTGELTFAGSLESAGRGIETIVANASGEGDLGLCCGELRERNLLAELVAAVGREATASAEAGAAAATVLERARRVPVLAAALAQSTTPFDDIAGSVAIDAGSVSFDGLALDTPLLHASATGSLTRAGALDVQGTVTLTADATAALVQLLPEAGRLFASGTKLEVPFTASGRWPDVRVEVDVRTAIARAAAPLDPRALSLVPLLARVAG